MRVLTFVATLGLAALDGPRAQEAPDFSPGSEAQRTVCTAFAECVAFPARGK
jgi:hypothetical protein